MLLNRITALNILGDVNRNAPPPPNAHTPVIYIEALLCIWSIGKQLKKRRKRDPFCVVCKPGPILNVDSLCEKNPQAFTAGFIRTFARSIPHYYSKISLIRWQKRFSFS